MMNISKLFLAVCFLLTGCVSSPKQPVADAADDKPLVVFVTGDHEYSSEATMPLLAKALEENYNMRTIVLKSSPDQNAEENIK